MDMAGSSKTISKTVSRSALHREVSGRAEFTDLVRALKALFDPYRPELHYMRGPGPKWHAKHDPAPAAVDSLSLMPWSAKA
jgi:hypothetical protein